MGDCRAMENTAGFRGKKWASAHHTVQISPTDYREEGQVWAFWGSP